MTSVITATTEVVISEKSKPEFASCDFSRIAVSRMSRMRISASFDLLDACVADDLGPPRDIGLDLGRELRRRIGDRSVADRRQALFHLRQGDDARDLAL